MTSLHKWDTTLSDTFDRMNVPGGWIYQTRLGITFVPHPLAGASSSLGGEGGEADRAALAEEAKAYLVGVLEPGEIVVKCSKCRHKFFSMVSYVEECKECHHVAFVSPGGTLG